MHESESLHSQNVGLNTRHGSHYRQQLHKLIGQAEERAAIKSVSKLLESVNLQ